VHGLCGSVVRIALNSLRRVFRDVQIDLRESKRVVKAIVELRLERESGPKVARGDDEWTEAVLDELVAYREGNGSRASGHPFWRAVLESMVSLTPKACGVEAPHWITCAAPRS
jgi:hypothetical protein